MIWIYVSMVKIIFYGVVFFFNGVVFGSNCVPLFVTGTSKILSKVRKLLIINFWTIHIAIR
jgi:hypothetical protein